MRLALALIIATALFAAPALAQGYLNPPIYAWGYLWVQPGGTVTTTVANTRSPPTNLGAGLVTCP